MGLTVTDRQLIHINLTPSVLGSPADGTTYYFSNFNAAPQSASSTIHQCTFDKACTIIAANINSVTGVAGSNEAWVLHIRINDTTDTQIASVSSTAQGRVWANNTLNINIAVGDKFVIKAVSPTWGTNPTNLVWSGYLTIQL